MTRASTTATAGLAICGLLGVVDVAGLRGLGADDAPPAGIVVLGAVLGLLTLWGVSIAWRGQRKGAMIVIVTRLISALLAIPAFFVDDIADWIVPAVATALVLTAIGVALVMASLRRGAFAA